MFERDIPLLKIPPGKNAEKTPILLVQQLWHCPFFVRLRFLRHVVIDPPSISTRHFPHFAPKSTRRNRLENFARQLLGRFRNAFTGRVHFDQTVRINGCQKPEPSGWNRKLYQLGFLVKYGGFPPVNYMGFELFVFFFEKFADPEFFARKPYRNLWSLEVCDIPMLGPCHRHNKLVEISPCQPMRIRVKDANDRNKETNKQRSRQRKSHYFGYILASY